jgi:hypothetical protein
MGEQTTEQDVETIQQRFRRLLSSEPVEFCPFLGFRTDPEVRATYASSKNYCHSVDKPLPASRSQQNQYCLTSSFATCKFYLKHAEDLLVSPSKPSPLIDNYGDALMNLISGVLGSE